ncbi:hypothetical protein PAAG_11361 [Paracoccidioides lutzii Pb01]|uniref:Uncharacterized protein n=1 Tax=Paracoccidioides lutzii (strain ATCC MYA-826 / Pb01) TaxID=502779 RepID=A0A0A2V767_PARBA|nr:hypothetical protein PAAG_11361 [Paracoccidioides lutzii Pb01]KGQ01965.1 hypothetical protein PAAG_11361 [Paracoccidioides lutzii Pb01]
MTNYETVIESSMISETAAIISSVLTFISASITSHASDTVILENFMSAKLLNEARSQNEQPEVTKGVRQFRLKILMRSSNHQTLQPLFYGVWMITSYHARSQIHCQKNP